MKVEHAKEAYKISAYVWENRDLKVQAVIIYVHSVWANLCIMFIFLFKPSFCNGPETELKCKIGLRTYVEFSF